MRTDPGIPGLVVAGVDVDGDEFPAWLRAVRRIFKDPTQVGDDLVADRRRRFAGQDLVAVRDRDGVVATFRSWTTGMTVPGRGTGPAPAVDVMAISSVTVASTHRRRGILTHLMSTCLRDAADGGAAAAVLIASEATIYGRYGFGVATRGARWTLDLGRLRAQPGAQDPVPGRYLAVSPEQLRPVAPSIAEGSRRAGTIDRDDVWWDLVLGIDPPAEPGATPPMHVVLLADDAPSPRGPDVTALDPSVVQGYLRYRVREQWQGRDACCEVSVVHLVGRDADAEASLWRYLAGLDLVATVVAENRPLDEPVAWLLPDPRAVTRGAAADMLWLRPLNVVALLEARGYPDGISGTVTFTVRDPAGLVPGTYRLEVADGRGRCVRVPEDPGGVDLELDVDVLGAACLGDRAWTNALPSGRMRECRHGAVARLAALLCTVPAPWAATGF